MLSKLKEKIQLKLSDTIFRRVKSTGYVQRATKILEDIRIAKVEAERQRKLEAERIAKLEAERQAKVEAERQRKLEAERIAKLEAERQAKLEAIAEDRIKNELVNEQAKDTKNDSMKIQSTEDLTNDKMKSSSSLENDKNTGTEHSNTDPDIEEPRTKGNRVTRFVVRAKKKIVESVERNKLRVISDSNNSMTDLSSAISFR